MRAVIQRASFCEVTINGKETRRIGPGLLVLLGITHNDGNEDIEWLSGKISRLRIFNDENGVMNLPVTETGGDIMVVSQFTLHALTKKGNRPSYVQAARAEEAIPLYNQLVAQLRNDTGKMPVCGEFGADMQVHLNNDGPVTIIMDSKNRE
jgi:D-aminoacyl-tRNA deacylase